MRHSFFSKQSSDQPPAHVLMPAYNCEQFIEKAISSVLDQNYKNLHLIILNDGSTDSTAEKIEALEKLAAEKGVNVSVLKHEKNQGVALSRIALLEHSKKLADNAFVFWLDADDAYAHNTVIKDAIYQMQTNNADVCLLDFTVEYEDPNQKANAAGLLKEKEKIGGIIEKICKAGRLTAADFNPLEFTSLGWTKCYGPSAVKKLPQPGPYPFEDFVFMAVLLETSMTALEKPAIRYLRRSTSICGQRRPEHFTKNIPDQLAIFLDYVVTTSHPKDNYPSKLNHACEFVSNKLEQYKATLENLLEAPAPPAGFTESTLARYLKQCEDLNEMMDIFKKEVEENQSPSP